MHLRQTLSILLSALAFALSPSALARQYVNSLEDFLIHTRSHIERVEKLGMELFTHYRQRFPDVDPDLMRDFLRLHDRSKIDPALSKGRPHTLAEDLYTGYGRAMGRGQPNENRNFLKVVDELNASDRKVSLDFFRAHGLLDAGDELTPIAREMLLIEKVADQVDRSLSPVSAEEFHKVMEPAVQWMKKPEERELARYLVQPGLYKRVVAGSTYPELRAARALRGPCAQELFTLLRGLPLTP